MSDIGDWFRSIPFITRSWFAASLAVPLIGKLGLIDFRNLMLFPELVLSRFQLWRPVTATLYFPITPNTGFLFLVNLYFLYHYSTRLETGAFDGRPADYIFMLLFNWICIVITGMLMNMRLLMIPLIMSVLYVWAQFNKETVVSFWFGTRFKYPMDLGGRAFLSTPEFLYRFFPSRRGGVSGFGVAPSRPAAQEQGGGGGAVRGRHNWGQGFRLGGMGIE
uniref:Derlin n=1 Tax=Gasterosteus aculeatus aculeatus TaxID=481459 RepID=A0AAQ4S7B4_GASAC